MSESKKVKASVRVNGLPSIWITAWIFTIGYADLGFWQGVWAILIWPYYLGVLFAN